MEGKMKYAFTIILVTLMLAAGCSKEEDTDSAEYNTFVRKPIKVTASSSTEKPSPSAVVEDASVNTPEDIDKGTEESDSATEQDSSQKKQAQYIVQDGDTLVKIATRKDVYNDHLKWAVIYRDNREILAGHKKRPYFPDTGLTKGMILNYTTDDEFQLNLLKQQGNHYVINVLSSPDIEKINPITVKLIDKGFFTYITGTKVNGKDWYRLRVGFFNTRSDAQETGQKIKGLLGISEIWAVKIEDNEFREFGGY